MNDTEDNRVSAGATPGGPVGDDRTSARGTGGAGPVRIAVTGVGLALPGADGPAGLLGTGPAGPEPYDTGAVIGRRGHRYKDRATQLALCAAVHGLRDARLIGAADEELAVPGHTVGVVASSNLGNLDTVCRVAAEITEQGADRISPMSTPNASSNVVASSVALRFGLRGPNLMLCNGPTSGVDAVHFGAGLIAAGRAGQVLVIGTESRNDIVGGLLGTDPAELLDGAVALVLETTAGARRRGVTPVAVLGRYERRAGLGRCVETLLSGTDDRAAPGVWFTPERYRDPAGPDTTGPDTAGTDPGAPHPVPVDPAVPRHDLTRAFGLASGALGVLQCAAATGWIAAGGTGRALVTCGDDTTDGVAGILVEPYGAP
ncbi:beta-ketoacyl synthase [Streptomyces pactum]|uniref:Beta-ketoacyl synthase n=1 Tax=Streptomyces pactum TaxID=68249 RepID=A0ABS0NIP9_9ACTN|nr:beta-ketoacyl synthase N-terminal-like domain-containing protein [Streptomyces pactum]MBH5335064.1 beta-ketoacyl synthase [Streptomyces pactum]